MHWIGARGKIEWDEGERNNVKPIKNALSVVIFRYYREEGRGIDGSLTGASASQRQLKPSPQPQHSKKGSAGAGPLTGHNSIKLYDLRT